MREAKSSRNFGFDFPFGTREEIELVVSDNLPRFCDLPRRIAATQGSKVLAVPLEQSALAGSRW
jgi:hypothetical protein